MTVQTLASQSAASDTRCFELHSGLPSGVVRKTVAGVVGQVSLSDRRNFVKSCVKGRTSG